MDLVQVLRGLFVFLGDGVAEGLGEAFEVGVEAVGLEDGGHEVAVGLPVGVLVEGERGFLVEVEHGVLALELKHLAVLFSAFFHDVLEGDEGVWKGVFVFLITLDKRLDRCLELLPNQQPHIHLQLPPQRLQIPKEIQLTLIFIPNLQPQLLNLITQTQIILLQHLKILHIDRLDHTCRLRREINQLLYIRAERTERAEARPRIQRLEMRLRVRHIIQLRNRHVDLALLQEMYLIRDVSELDDGGHEIVAMGLEQVDYLLDDVVVEVAEIRDVLDHLSSEVEVYVGVLADLGFEVDVDLGELLFDFFEAVTLEVGEGGVVAGFGCGCAF